MIRPRHTAWHSTRKNRSGHDRSQAALDRTGADRRQEDQHTGKLAHSTTMHALQSELLCHPRTMTRHLNKRTHSHTSTATHSEGTFTVVPWHANAHYTESESRNLPLVTVKWCAGAVLNSDATVEQCLRCLMRCLEYLSVAMFEYNHTTTTCTSRQGYPVSYHHHMYVVVA